MFGDFDEHVQACLNRVDRWEAHRIRRIELGTERVVQIGRQGTAVVVYEPEDQWDRLDRLNNRAIKVSLLWQSRYPNMLRDFLDAIEYAHIVIDQRLGLRKTLSWRGSQYMDRYIRAAIREQIDGIIATLSEIEEMTSDTRTA